MQQNSFYRNIGEKDELKKMKRRAWNFHEPVKVGGVEMTVKLKFAVFNNSRVCLKKNFSRLKGHFLSTRSVQDLEGHQRGYSPLVCLN